MALSSVSGRRPSRPLFPGSFCNFPSCVSVSVIIAARQDRALPRTLAGASCGAQAGAAAGGCCWVGAGAAPSRQLLVSLSGCGWGRAQALGRGRVGQEVLGGSASWGRRCVDAWAGGPR